MLSQQTPTTRDDADAHPLAVASGSNPRHHAPCRSDNSPTPPPSSAPASSLPPFHLRPFRAKQAPATHLPLRVARTTSRSGKATITTPGPRMSPSCS